GADALRRLAGRLAQREGSESETLRSVPRPAGGPGPLSSPPEARGARRLAHDQRGLRDEPLPGLREPWPAPHLPPENPLAALQALQEVIARDAAALAKAIGQRNGTDADAARQAGRGADSARQASQQIAGGMAGPALESGRRAAEALRKLAGD